MPLVLFLYQLTASIQLSRTFLGILQAIDFVLLLDQSIITITLFFMRTFNDLTCFNRRLFLLIAISCDLYDTQLEMAETIIRRDEMFCGLVIVCDS